MRARIHETIAGRLYLVGGLAMAAVAALAAVSIYFAVNTGRAAEVLFDGSLVGAVEAGEMEILLERHRRVVEAVPLETDRELIARDIRAAEDVSRRIESLVARTDKSFSQHLEKSLPQLWSHGREVMRLAENFAQERAIEEMERYAAAADQLQKNIRIYRSERVSLADREAGTLIVNARRLVNSVTGFAILAFVLIGPLALIMLRSMILRLNQITTAMTRLARNDTAVTVASTGDRDEIGEMARAVEIFKSNAINLLDHQHQLERLNSWLDVALNNMTRGLSMFDADKRLVISNAAYTQIYSLTPELTKPGTSFASLVEHRSKLVHKAESNDAGHATDVGAILQFVADRQSEARITQRFNDGRVVEVSVKPLAWGGWVALHEDVTERLKAAEKISELARTDALTGLANRLLFREQLERTAAALERNPAAGFALLCIDLDKFKEVNDTFGHPCGDALLVAVGQRLRDTVRGEDVVARLGGDEFAILQSEVTSRDDADALSARVIALLHQPFLVQGHRLEIGATIGIAIAPADGSSPVELMRNADIALYRAKREKRGTYCFFDPAMEGLLRARRALEADLGQAIAAGQFELHYQPIVSLKHHIVAGAEALIRWRHPERGMVSPADFIPLAEATGLINAIGAWAMAEACRLAVTLPDNLRISVNLSVAQFAGPDLATIAASALRDSGLAASRLELEVTESLFLGDDPATLAHLHRLRDLGLSIALDDFGTGYSSLSLLRSFPFDKIKIDQTFIRELPERPNCEAIVGAVAGLAHSLDMTTVAEGVETDGHLAHVEAAGCDEVQGYLFSRPVPAADLMHVITGINQRLTERARAA